MKSISIEPISIIVEARESTESQIFAWVSNILHDDQSVFLCVFLDLINIVKNDGRNMGTFRNKTRILVSILVEFVVCLSLLI